MLAVNNLDDTPLMLLVNCAEQESAEEVFASLHERYDARLGDAQFGPKYKVGATYVYDGQRFSKLCTFAGSLVMRIVFDVRHGKFDRPVIYRFDSGESLRLLNPRGPESEIDESDLGEERFDERDR